MNASKLYLLGTLILAFFMVVPAMAGVPGPFTGNVEVDFDPALYEVLVITDWGPVVEGLPGKQSGWDIKDIRLAYDPPPADIMYVGINSFGIIGDTDGNGNPDNSDDQSIVPDYPNLEQGESVCVYFDLNFEDVFINGLPTWDVIAGVPGDLAYDDFLVAEYFGPHNPPSNFRNPLLNHYDPLSDPTLPSVGWEDYEFTIQNFSGLAASLAPFRTGFTNPQLNEFRVAAYTGSPNDNISEDVIYYHQRPSTVVTITPSGLAVIQGSTVDLIVTEHNDGESRRGQANGPTTEPEEVPFHNVLVEVTQDGIPLPWSPLGAPPDDGDVAPLGILNGPDPTIPIIGETWTWGTVTTLTSNPITAKTPFVARGSGTDPIGFVHTFAEDPEEEDIVSVEIISTDVDLLTDPPVELPPGGGNVTLTINERNDGSADLLDPNIEVFAGPPGGPYVPIGTFYKTSPEFQGGDDDGDDELDGTESAPPLGETWQWQVVVPGVVVTTEFVVIGHGTDPVLGWDVTWCETPEIPEVFCDEDERDSKVVGVPEPPVIDVNKTVDCVEPLPVPGSDFLETLPGYPVYYRICIKNIGPVPVFPTLVEDDRLGNLTLDFLENCPLPLMPGTECCQTYGPFFYDGSENPLPNEVTFEAIDESQVFPAEPVFDDATVVLVDPNFEVTKTCLTDPVPEGLPAKFEIVITNTGNVNLIVLTDEPTLPGPELLPAFGLPIIHEVSVPVPPDVNEVCNVINVMAFVDTPDNICIDGEPVEPPKDANDCCPVPPPGGEGCTPGFWKNNGDKHGASAWCERFSPSDPISMHFVLNDPLVVRGKGRSKITNPTLLQALNANGGGVNAMIRHGIAAMLNACSDCVEYEYSSEDQVIMMIEDALNGVGDYTVGELHVMFASYNEAGCPVNQHGNCVGVED